MLITSHLRSADDFFSQPVPAQLCHYTSVAGFQGIVELRKIFATDIRFLNDEREFTYALDLVSKMTSETVVQESDGFPLRSLISGVVNQHLTKPFVSAHFALLVTSFSELEDTLSQWRGYSSGSTGVMMALDLRSLRHEQGQQVLQTLAPCLYLEADQRKLIKLCLQNYIKDARALWSKGLDASVKSDIPPTTPNFGVTDSESVALHFRHAQSQLQAGFDLLRAAALCKHPLSKRSANGGWLPLGFPR